MRSRDRIAAILSHEEPDRVGFMDADTWQETINRWWIEGLPRCVDGAWLNADGLRYFGMDIYCISAPTPCGYDQVILEDFEEYQVIRDQWGGKTRRWKHRSGPPLYIEPAVKGPEEFESRIMPLFEADVNTPADLMKEVCKMGEEFYVTLNVGGTFDLAMSLFGGLGPTLILIQKRREFMSKVFDTIGKYWANVAEEYVDAGFDGLWVFDDLGSKDGPFFSPSLYRQLVMPAHQRICRIFSRRDLPVLLHSDGCLNEFLPLFMECGFNAIHPVQAGAGMILGNLKEKYGDRMGLFGGISVDPMTLGDPELIKQEVVSKLSKGAPGGGYIAACDSPVPPFISLASYEFFVRAIKRYGQYRYP